MSLNLFEKYQNSREKYFQFIIKLKDVFILNGILYDEKIDNIKKFLNSFKVLIDAEIERIKTIDVNITYIYINTDFARFYLNKHELYFLKDYLLPELFNYGLKIMLYESQQINLETLSQDEDGKKLTIGKKTIYGKLSFSQILSEFTRLQLHFSYNPRKYEIIKIQDKKGESKFSKTLLLSRILNKDNRLYTDIIIAIKSYIQDIDSEVDMYIDLVKKRR
jgi:hypothetical protein